MLDFVEINLLHMTKDGYFLPIRMNPKFDKSNQIKN